MTAPAGPHRVRRPFVAGEQRLAVGTVVDITGWRNAYQLVDRGYLVAAPDQIAETESSACARCGAVADEPCRTPSGKPAASNHAGRN